MAGICFMIPFAAIQGSRVQTPACGASAVVQFPTAQTTNKDIEIGPFLSSIRYSQLGPILSSQDRNKSYSTVSVASVKEKEQTLLFEMAYGS